MDAPFIVKVTGKYELIAKTRFDDPEDARAFAEKQAQKYMNYDDITVSLDIPGQPLEFIE